MLHACFVSTLLYFVYTLRCFYIFSRTNLLTSCHNASCLFSSVFGSRKEENQYSRNWTRQKLKSIFYLGDTKSRGETERQVRAAKPPRRGQGWARTYAGCGPPSRLPASPLC